MPARPESLGAKPKGPARSLFWVDPLVVGACFALGYGITQRVIQTRAGLQQSQPQSFSSRSFPGESLEGLRVRYADDKPLAADVASKELKEAKELKETNALEQAKLAKQAEQRKAKEQADRIAAASLVRQRNQQAVVNTSRPVEDLPTLNEETVFETEVDLQLVDPELGLSEPMAVPESDPVLDQAAPGFEVEAPVIVESAVVDPVVVDPVVLPPALDEPELFVAPVAAPPAP